MSKGPQLFSAKLQAVLFSNGRAVLLTNTPWPWPTARRDSKCKRRDSPPLERSGIDHPDIAPPSWTLETELGGE